MVTSFRRSLLNISRCPHCKSSFLMWDNKDKEPFCVLCGWREAVALTSEQSKSKFRREKDFWNNLITENEICSEDNE